MSNFSNTVKVKMTFRHDRFYVYLPKKYEGYRVTVTIGAGAENVLLTLAKTSSQSDGPILSLSNKKSKFVKAICFYDSHNIANDFRRYNSICGQFRGKTKHNAVYIEDFNLPEQRTVTIKRRTSKKARSGMSKIANTENIETTDSNVTVRELQDAIKAINAAHKQYGVRVIFNENEYSVRLSA